jgi:hypothetical protein
MDAHAADQDRPRHRHPRAESHEAQQVDDHVAIQHAAALDQPAAGAAGKRRLAQRGFLRNEGHRQTLRRS